MKKSLEFKEVTNPPMMKGGPEAARVTEGDVTVRALFGVNGLVLDDGGKKHILRYDAVCKALLPEKKAPEKKKKKK